MKTHASFFSGGGGMDIGLERAGWHTVSFSEIEPYACSILEARWPGTTNLGDIVQLAGGGGGGAVDRGADSSSLHESDDWRAAILWTGGFPCQDLSVAGKRAGMGSGTRSGLAFAFLDLVERYRPPAITLENVPGLLSSHGGRDMAALIGRMVELGYGVAYRTLDAQFFGVPQRRRRVFILGLRSDPDDVDGRVAAERAAAILSVGYRCERHPATGHETGTEPAARVGRSVTGSSGKRHDPDTDTYIANALGTASGGPDDNDAQAHRLVTGTLRVGGRASGAGSSYDNTPWTVTQALRGQPYADHDGDDRKLIVAATVRASDGHHGHGSPRGDGQDNLIAGTMQGPSPHRGWPPLENATDGYLVSAPPDSDRMREATGLAGRLDDSPLDPEGIDSARYRVIGNGVAAPVAEWVGRRLAEAPMPE